MELNVDGIHYHLNISGSGFPLVLLHGFTGDLTTWDDYLVRWGHHSTLVALDIIGHGKTESPNNLKRYQIESVANDIAFMLDELGITQVDVLGYSMGGRLALTFACLFPNRVRKLILESASPGLGIDEERNLRRIKDGELAKFIQVHGIQSFVDYWEEIPLFHSMKSLPERIKGKVREQRLRNVPHGLTNSLLGMGTGSQPSWWSLLDDLSCEVLIITGDKDLKFCGIAEKMLKKLKKGSWSIIDNSGHTIHVEQPEKFGTIVSDFLISN